MSDGSVRWRVLTPRSAAGAVAGVELTGGSEELDQTLRMLGVGSLPDGRVGVRRLAGIDEGIAARWSVNCVHLMPHGGIEIVRRLAAALLEAGVAEAAGLDDRRLRIAYPEARDLIESRMLAKLAEAPSPRGIDLLLDQPRRWRMHGSGALPGPDTNHSRMLDRLTDPPVVVAIGASNIGKSSLTNALAGRHVSIVADEVGTTRDHVGVMLDVDGMAVRFVDAPGRRADARGVEAEGIAAVGQLLKSAQLVLLCGDSASPPPDAGSVGSSADSLMVLLRADVGAARGWSPDVATSARTGRGIRELGERIRRALVTDEALADARPWQFWRG